MNNEKNEYNTSILSELDLQTQPPVGVIGSGPAQVIPNEVKALALYRVIGLIALGDVILIATAPLLFWFALLNAMLILLSLPILLLLLLVASYFAIRVKLAAKKLHQDISGLHTLIPIITIVAVILATITTYLMLPDDAKFLSH